jgi:octaheme c-type cytochrome (tetrathionate reductase family)
MPSVDCLVCHDTTGTYAKKNNKCGYPNKDVNLAAVAKSVGMPGRSNCGACHWYGGGGNGVKHGDLDDTLTDPEASHDVHMGGLDFTCQECHVATNHRIAGSSTTSAVSEGNVSCTDCHDEKPHEPSSPLLKQLNDHCDAITCQTCHIPRYAKAVSTVTMWDWSQSGGEDKMLLQTENRVKQLSRRKGLLIQERNAVPAYAWYNGKHYRHLKGDPVKLTGLTELNPPAGDIHDPAAKITPYKIMNGVEPADSEYGYLIVPQLFGDGYFKNFDWQDAAQKGMKAAGLEFSGKITFVQTKMHWRLNHEVVPAKNALSCLDCHHPDGVMDFKALGYKGDPIVYGGRFKKLPLGNSNNQ